jgi:hypothetical protein
LLDLLPQNAASQIQSSGGKPNVAAAHQQFNAPAPSHCKKDSSHYCRITKDGGTPALEGSSARSASVLLDFPVETRLPRQRLSLQSHVRQIVGRASMLVNGPRHQRPPYLG